MAPRSQVRTSPPRESVVRYFSAHRLFEVLPEAAIRDLDADVIERTYPKSHYLYQVGDPASFVFIVKTGLVALTDLDEQGHARPVQTHSAGSAFGLGTVILRAPRRFTASAVTDVEAYLVPNETFQRLYRGSPALGYRVAEELASMLCRSEQTTVRFSLTPVASRIASFLLESAAREGGRTDSGSLGRLTLSRQDLALIVGTSRETATRILGRLSREKIIAMNGQRIHILRPEHLRRIAEE